MILGTVFNIMGLIGVALILWIYCFVQMGKVKIAELKYSVINLIGSLFIALSLVIHFNLSAMIIEIAWSLISILGIYKYYKTKGEKNGRNR